MIYTNNKQVGLSANEVNNLVTKLVENKQDKKIVFEGQEMLLSTALQRVNNSAVGKANIIDAEQLPDSLTPNSQYWVKTYNGQTIDNGRYIILVDNLGTPHFMGQSISSPTVNDVQINGKSIIDGATQIANIQPKATIDDTATENDIPSAKGTWDLVNNRNDLFDASKFLMADEFASEATYKTEGKVFKIFNDLYAISLNLGFYDKPQVNQRVSYRARFILNDGTNLLDREFLLNRPITLYDTDGDIAGSMRLDKDAIMFYFTKSVNEYYCNGLLFRF